MNGAAYDNARQVILVLLKRAPEGRITPDFINDTFAQCRPLFGPDVDVNKLLKEIQETVNTQMDAPTEIHEDHVDWLPARRAQIEWKHWRRYRRYLEEDQHWPPTVMMRLEELTDKILGFLEDPLKPESWNRRGMVVGQVQSGKTTNYLGLICKAVDSGYKLIIILAGMHDDLRSQTQIRVDEYFLGIDTRNSQAPGKENISIGVGKLAGESKSHVACLTNADQKGDFSTRSARAVHMAPGSDPIILVVKKNVSVLKNFHRWVQKIIGQKHEGRTVVKDIPLLLIDDEADIASINTRGVPLDENGKPDPDHQVSAINGEIRKILHSFDKKAYVGYTATPFANVFIHEEDWTHQHGEDLFPRDFIINIPPPSNYVGPREVFGLGESIPGLDATPGLDIIRSVDDQGDWIPEAHKKDQVPGALPGSLKEALRVFVLGCAARAARGQERKHKSMLVHVTRFTAVQHRVKEQIDEELVGIKHRLVYADRKGEPLLAELRELWEGMRRCSRDIARSRPEGADDTPWEQVLLHLPAEVRKIEVREINGVAADVLCYKDHEETGLSVIAVGGDKLSRGLTLEGLMVSYYLRASKMYDTLMQMGRWFGYRPGYLDLCRLYTSDELKGWYRDITLASEELRQEFEVMALSGLTPKDFGLRVRTHPDGLLITAANKLREGVEMDLSFAGNIVETIDFYKSQDKLDHNIQHVGAFIRQLEKEGRARLPGLKKAYHAWQTEAPEIESFLEGYLTHPAARKVQSGLLVRYIQAQRQRSRHELQRWTVVLVSKQLEDERDQFVLGGLEISLITRRPTKEDRKERHSIGRLVSPTDEQVDLTEAQRRHIKEQAAQVRKRRAAIKAAKADGVTPPVNETDEEGSVQAVEGVLARKARDPGQGLLLIYPLSTYYQPTGRKGEYQPIKGLPLPPIGIALSFPYSETAQPISYRVNNKYWEQEFGEP